MQTFLGYESSVTQVVSISVNKSKCLHFFVPVSWLKVILFFCCWLKLLRVISRIYVTDSFNFHWMRLYVGGKTSTAQSFSMNIQKAPYVNIYVSHRRMKASRKSTIIKLMRWICVLAKLTGWSSHCEQKMGQHPKFINKNWHSNDLKSWIGCFSFISFNCWY